MILSDQVEIRDREDVLVDTQRKLKKVWPECDPSQIIPFSAVEAKIIQDKGALTPKYNEVLERLKVLLPEAHETVMLKGYR